MKKNSKQIFWSNSYIEYWYHIFWVFKEKKYHIYGNCNIHVVSLSDIISRELNLDVIGFNLYSSGDTDLWWYLVGARLLRTTVAQSGVDPVCGVGGAGV